MGKICGEKKKKKKKWGQREGTIEILWTLSNSIRKKQKRKKREERKKKKKSRVLSYSTYNKLSNKTNCPELKRLQFPETNIFNIFWI